MKHFYNFSSIDGKFPFNCGVFGPIFLRKFLFVFLKRYLDSVLRADLDSLNLIFRFYLNVVIESVELLVHAPHVELVS